MGFLSRSREGRGGFQAERENQAHGEGGSKKGTEGRGKRLLRFEDSKDQEAKETMGEEGKAEEGGHRILPKLSLFSNELINEGRVVLYFCFRVFLWKNRDFRISIH